MYDLTLLTNDCGQVNNLEIKKPLDLFSVKLNKDMTTRITERSDRFKLIHSSENILIQTLNNYEALK